jgi:hypothetical protein
MDYEFKPEAVVQELLEREKDYGPATEDLRLCLNHIIKERNLDAFSVMTVLARLSAGYVHQMQMLYDDMGATEVVEETFQHIFTTFLTSYDMERVAKEVDQMKREELN